MRFVAVVAGLEGSWGTGGTGVGPPFTDLELEKELSPGSDGGGVVCW